MVYPERYAEIAEVPAEVVARVAYPTEQPLITKIWFLFFTIGVHLKTHHCLMALQTTLMQHLKNAGQNLNSYVHNSKL